MKVLHIYPKSDELIRRHVVLLAEGMRQSADIRFVDNSADFRTQLQEGPNLQPLDHRAEHMSQIRQLYYPWPQ